MNENLKDLDVLLVKEKGSDELKVVSGIENDGNLKTVKPAAANEPDFLRIDRSGNLLENFFENFSRQVKDPTHFMFFRAPADRVEETVNQLQDALKNPEKPENREFLDMHRVEPEDFKNRQTQEQLTQPQVSNNAIDESRVDWNRFERLGLSREFLEKTDNLDKLLNWQKTGLLPISVKTDGISLRTDARLALRETDGNLTVAIHAIRKEPELDKFYFGIRFTEEDKQNLLKTGNLGRIAEVEYRQGEKTPVLISIDRKTNELLSYRADKVQIPEIIKGVTLDEQQKRDLSEGKAVWVENMISSKNTPFAAYLQFNADKRSLEFRFDNDRQAQSQSQNQGQNQTPFTPGEVPKTFRQKELTEDNRESLREGKTVYIDGLVDKKGKPYSGYVTYNQDTGKSDFMFQKQYKEALAANKVIPDDRHKTQVAVNSEGKTDEATKNLKEPLNQSQTQPNETQAEKIAKDDRKDETKKSQGRKM